MKTLKAFRNVFKYLAVGVLGLAVLFATVPVVEISAFVLPLVALAMYGISHVFGCFYRKRVFKYYGPQGPFKTKECAAHAPKAKKCCCKDAEAAEDVVIERIMKWKRLYDEGIITDREFVEKRNEILGIER